MSQSATLFSTIFLIALALSVVLHLWLARRQMRHVQRHRASVPEHFTGKISLEAHHKAADYTAARARLSIVDTLLDAVVLLALTLGGGVALIASWATSLPVGTPRSFTLLSVPFYLVSEIPRLVGAIRKGASRVASPE